MENNGKGAGIFYGVIGVATLVITIIGATFAYFSATTNSAENAITAGGATITLGFDDSVNVQDVGLKKNLIPINPALDGFNEGFVGITENKCKDVNKNNICSVYQFTVSNPDGNTVAQRIFGSIVPKSNDFTNFYFAIFKGTAADVDARAAKTVVADDTAADEFDDITEIKLADALKINKNAKVGDTVKVGWDVDGKAVTGISTDYLDTSDENYQFTKTAQDAARKHVIGNKGDLIHSATHVENKSTAAISIPAFEQILDVKETMTYTVVMWIQETGTAQNEDMGKSFAGGVNFTTEGGGSGVTGVLSTTSQ